MERGRARAEGSDRYRSYVGMNVTGLREVKARVKTSVRAVPFMSRATGNPNR